MEVNLKMFTFHAAANNLLLQAEQLQAAWEILKAAGYDYPEGSADHATNAKVSQALNVLRDVLYKGQ